MGIEGHILEFLWSIFSDFYVTFDGSILGVLFQFLLYNNAPTRRTDSCKESLLLRE